MKKIFMLLGSILVLFAAGGCGDECGDTCGKAQRCQVVPGPLGADPPQCVSNCRSSSFRRNVVECIGTSSCEDIRAGRCGGW